MSFKNLGLNPLLPRNLLAMGYRRPRPIQAEAIGPMLAGRDVIGLAKTGTGKTAAFLTPIAHLLLESPPPRTPGKPVPPMSRLRALVLCPTRELAQQVAQEAGRIIQGTVLRVACAYGKVGIKPQADAIARGVDLLVATPGRVRELIDANALSLEYVRYVTVDEADRMLDMGFLPQVSAILESVRSPRQIALFTATMPDEVQHLARSFLVDPVHVEVDPHTTPVEHVKQKLISVHDRDKVSMLMHLLRSGHERGVLVFCRTRRRVGWVGTALQRHGFACGMIHGDRSQAQRQRALDRFAKGELNVLIATDVAARGLHIPATRTVINYDLPMAAEEYVHRIGRAGHGGGFGEAFTFLPQRDENRWKELARAISLRLRPEPVEGFEPTMPVRTARSSAASKAKPQSKAKAQSKTKRKSTSKGDARKSATSAKSSTRGKSSPGGRGTKKPSRPIRKGEKPGAGVRRRAT